MQGIEISTGRLTALWLVLGTVKALGAEADRESVLAAAARSGMRAGALPIKDGLSLARQGGFLSEEDGASSLTPLGEYALDLGSGSEPNQAVMRLFASALVFAFPPFWVTWWQSPSVDLEEKIPKDHREVLEAAGLYPPTDDSDTSDTLGWAWWNALGEVPVARQVSPAHRAVSCAGEQLTVEYERRRLEATGYGSLAEKVTWLARESEAYGFDVLSYAGDDLEGFQPQEPIAIEVKSSSRVGATRFAFRITAHEWGVARILGPSSLLHIWPGVVVGPPPTSMADAPVVLPVSALAPHLPGPPECSEQGCSWHTALLTLDLTAFQ